MTFDEWKSEVAAEMNKHAMFGDGNVYMRNVDQCAWRAFYDEGLSPDEAVAAERDAALSLQ